MMVEAPLYTTPKSRRGSRCGGRAGKWASWVAEKLA